MSLVPHNYEHYRLIIEHEDNLINHRVSWLLIAQSFLLGACISRGEYPIGIVIFAIASTLIAYISILAALKAVNKIKKEIEEECINHSEGSLLKFKPSVISTGGVFFLVN